MLYVLTYILQVLPPPVVAAPREGPPPERGEAKVDPSALPGGKFDVLQLQGPQSCESSALLWHSSGRHWCLDIWVGPEKFKLWLVHEPAASTAAAKTVGKTVSAAKTVSDAAVLLHSRTAASETAAAGAAAAAATSPAARDLWLASSRAIAAAREAATAAAGIRASPRGPEERRAAGATLELLEYVALAASEAGAAARAAAAATEVKSSSLSSTAAKQAVAAAQKLKSAIISTFAAVAHYATGQSTAQTAAATTEAAAELEVASLKVLAALALSGPGLSANIAARPAADGFDLMAAAGSGGVSKPESESALAAAAGPPGAGTDGEEDDQEWVPEDFYMPMMEEETWLGDSIRRQQLAVKPLPLTDALAIAERYLSAAGINLDLLAKDVSGDIRICSCAVIFRSFCILKSRGSDTYGV